MKKKAIGVILTDTHLEKSTIEINKSIYKQAIDLCIQLNTPLFHAGDIFTARSAQPLEVLQAFNDILTMLSDTGIKMTVIPGNHDKTDLNSRTSYLNPFSHNPNLRLINQHYYIDLVDLRIHFIPYFKEDGLYIGELQKSVNELSLSTSNVLITHVSVNGVKNNDGSEVVNGIAKDAFNSFDKVFVGHYHNQSQIGENIFYIGSAYQANFGENNQKGFTVLYNDGSHEFIKSVFPEYIKVVIDIEDEVGLKKLQKEHADSLNNVRFVIKGDSSKLATIKKEKFAALGIDIKFESNEVNTNLMMASNNEFVSFDRSSIKDAYEKFCILNEITDKEFGLEKLNQLKQ